MWVGQLPVGRPEKAKCLKELPMGVSAWSSFSDPYMTQLRSFCAPAGLGTGSILSLRCASQLDRDESASMGPSASCHVRQVA